MVNSSIMFTKYDHVFDWAADLRDINPNVGVTTFGPTCIFGTAPACLPFNNFIIDLPQ